MKKAVVIVLLLALVQFSSYGQEEGIAFFEGTWAEMLAKAKEQDRIIFMDAYATWCGPCKQMSAKVFPLKEVGEYFNANFLPVKVDMEKGDGLALAKLYNVRAYPTLLFINWKGELVHKAVGGRQADGLIGLGKEALDDSKNFRSLEQAYMKNPGDETVIMNYAMALKESYDRSYTEVVKAWMQDKPMDYLLTETGWKLFSLFNDNPQSKEFQYFVAERATFEGKVGADAVNTKMDEIVMMMISQAVRKNDPAAMVALRKSIREMNPPRQDYYLAMADVQYSRRTSDWNTYAAGVLKLIPLTPDMEGRQLNSYAWDFYLNVEDQDALKKMTEYVAKAVKSEAEYALHDTYASLLYKTKNYKLALREAKAAIELARKEEAPYDETQELILEIEKAMKK